LNCTTTNTKGTHTGHELAGRGESVYARTRVDARAARGRRKRVAINAELTAKFLLVSEASNSAPVRATSASTNTRRGSGERTKIPGRDREKKKKKKKKKKKDVFPAARQFFFRLPRRRLGHSRDDVNIDAREISRHIQERTGMKKLTRELHHPAATAT
jgi:hypothetical protein